MTLDFTQKSAQVIKDAQNMAIKNGNPELTDLHLHLALIMDSEGFVARVLENMKIDLPAYRVRVKRAVENLPTQAGASQVYPNAVFQRILLNAEDEAKKREDSFISVEHIYLALLREKNVPSEEILREFQIRRKDFERALNEIRASRKVTSDNPEEADDVLEKYGKDLTKEARSGKHDPIIGRDRKSVV